MNRFVLTMLLATFFTSSLMAEKSGLYAGLDLLSSSNTFTEKTGNVSYERDVSSRGFKIKFGTVSEEGWRFQGYFLHEKYEKPYFDTTNDKLNEIGFDVIKGFEVTPKFSPFIQAGLGFGEMKTQRQDVDSVSEISFKLGAGLIYKITQAFELLFGLDIQGRAWEDIAVGTTTHEFSETSTKLYVGANFHF